MLSQGRRSMHLQDDGGEAAVHRQQQPSCSGIPTTAQCMKSSRPVLPVVQAGAAIACCARAFAGPGACIVCRSDRQLLPPLAAPVGV